MLQSLWKSITSMADKVDWKTLLFTLLAGVLGGGTVSQVNGCRQTPPTQPTPPEQPEEPPTVRPEPLQAICKLAMKNAYCSGTVVGPRRPDGRWNIVSAAHCFKTHGEQLQVIMRNGLTFNATVSAIDRRSDCAICVTDVIQELPFALVASTTPPVGTKIWHAGYGFDKPANREDGTIVNRINSEGQTQYRLSVSSGDSGGGIMMDAGGNLLSPVCCTTRIAGIGDVWGASPEVVNKMLANPTNFLDVPPVEIPIRPEPPKQMQQK